MEASKSYVNKKISKKLKNESKLIKNTIRTFRQIVHNRIKYKQTNIYPAHSGKPTPSRFKRFIFHQGLALR